MRVDWFLNYSIVYTIYIDIKNYYFYIELNLGLSIAKTLILLISINI